MILVRASAGGRTGVGYTYCGAPAAAVVNETLSQVVQGRDALTPTASWAAMQHAVRNLGRPGLVAQAVSAVDIALWDLSARLTDQPLSLAVGAVRESVPVYGSGGFTSYDDQQLGDQLSGWVGEGIPRVKMKVGRDPDRDRHRVQVAREAVGPGTELFVDANGAYSRKQALGWAGVYADLGVRWFEEPVSSEDLEGLRLLRDRGPGWLDVAAGEYGFDLPYFHRMLTAGAVDCLQADVTRALGVSGLLRVAALCDARSMDLSLHCAPQAGAHVAAAVWHLRHLEYFHDHVRIEAKVFDGVLVPTSGRLVPDRSRPGMGLTVREADIADHLLG
ncbi:mandelate racemase [Ornithinimicrobium avium]|uniref:Mandelate racemase n=2 Tax=Ornithinimicrobium avium TaxID=2283195 RepID=A0A345NS77_9MICO|nr:mandelate racemase [Ornithinimicrobium avium]